MNHNAVTDTHLRSSCDKDMIKLPAQTGAGAPRSPEGLSGGLQYGFEQVCCRSTSDPPGRSGARLYIPPIHRTPETHLQPRIGDRETVKASQKRHKSMRYVNKRAYLLLETFSQTQSGPCGRESISFLLAEHCSFATQVLSGDGIT